MVYVCDFFLLFSFLIACCIVCGCGCVRGCVCMRVEEKERDCGAIRII